MVKEIDSKLMMALGNFYDPIITIVKIIFIVILSIVVVSFGQRLIKKFFEKQKKFKYRINDKRIDTLSTMVVSVFRYSVYIMAAISILSFITKLFDLQPVLAAAGIGGIVLGFGSQSIIKDVLSGAFIVIEDQFAVGDLITIEDLNGTVEEMELRVTKLRNFNGDLYIIPNGEIKKVTNHTRGNKAVIVDIPIIYSADLDKAIDLANRVCETAGNEFESIVEAPKVLGITEMGKDNMTMRILAKALPNQQWEVERRIRKLIKDEFDKENIDFIEKNRLILDESLKGGNSHG
ncbi:MAG: MscS Mechanosensitive ion channel [Clostridiales bacterium]|jgi:small conductance mechanosensitive channel|nr:MscS Mechanosensitive ion channel [Clostridiales bacterium]